MIALDLFCGGGGVCAGLQDAGFEVVGIDNEETHGKRYPGHFICADALRPPVNLDDFDFVWCSPPCQRFSTATPEQYKNNHPDLIPEVRELIKDHPFTCIENVPLAPIRADVVLSGPMFGLNRVLRLRHFELSWFFGLQPPPIYRLRKNAMKDGYGCIITGSMSSPEHFYPRKRVGLPGKIPKREAMQVMGIRHDMTVAEIGESIPPAFAKFIGERMMESKRYTR